MSGNKPIKATDNEDESKVVTYKAAGGQTVVLSSAALEAYGTKYIDQLAATSGRQKLLLIDSNVLDDAQDKFPDSNSPLIDMYGDSLPNADDLISVSKNKDPSFVISNEDKTTFNKDLEDALESQIKDNSPAAVGKPGANAGTIIIPDPSTLADDTFKNKLIEGMSYLDVGKFGALPGSSMDWAKFTISHECAHLNNKDSDLAFRTVAENFNSAKSGKSNAENGIQSSRDTLGGEIRADISATKDFNIVSGAIPPVPQTIADLRLIGSFAQDIDVLDYGSNRIDDHNTGSSLIENFADPTDRPIDADRIQFTTAYTNTFVRGFIGAAEGEKFMRDKNGMAVISVHGDSPISSAMSRVLFPKSFEASIRGDDPMRVTALGTVISRNNPEKLYASTKVLYENGAFNSSPDVKLNAERFMRAVERTAPGFIKNDLIEQYQKAWNDPANQNYIQQLGRYYQDNPQIGSFIQPSRPDFIATTSSPQPIMTQ